MKLIIFAIACSLSFFSSSFAHAAETFKVRWVMAHNPTNEDVLSLIRNFSSSVSKRSEKRLEVELIALKDSDRHRHPLGVEKVRVGTAEISQVNVAVLTPYSKLINILTLPYFLRDHEHVKRVLNGEVGETILRDVLKGSKNKIQGMAFTYSGGLQVMFGRKQILGLNDLKGAMMASNFDGDGRNPGPRTPLFKHFGVKFSKEKILSRDEYVQAHEKGLIDFEDNELNRLYVLAKIHPEILNSVKYVTESNHAFYLTMIIANQKFLEKLPSDLREILKEEIATLAEKERELSIRQADEGKAYLSGKGVIFSQLEPAALEALKAESRKIQKSYSASLGGLMEKAQ